MDPDATSAPHPIPPLLSSLTPANDIEVEEKFRQVLKEVREVVQKAQELLSEVRNATASTKHLLGANSAAEENYNEVASATDKVVKLATELEPLVADAEELYKKALPAIAHALVPSLVDHYEKGSKRSFKIDIVLMLLSAALGAFAGTAMSTWFSHGRASDSMVVGTRSGPETADASKSPASPNPSSPEQDWAEYEKLLPTSTPVLSETARIRTKLLGDFRKLQDDSTGKTLTDFVARNRQQLVSLPRDSEALLLRQQLDYIDFQRQSAKTQWSEVVISATKFSGDLSRFQIADNYRFLTALAEVESGNHKEARRILESASVSRNDYIRILRPKPSFQLDPELTTVGEASKFLLQVVASREQRANCKVGIINSMLPFPHYDEDRIKQLAEMVRKKLSEAGYSVSMALRAPRNLAATQVFHGEACAEVKKDLLAKQDVLGDTVQAIKREEWATIFDRAGRDALEAQEKKQGAYSVIIMLGGDARLKMVRLSQSKAR